jgi:hypothetical protein
MNEMAVAARDSNEEDPFVISTSTALGRELIREMAVMLPDSGKSIWGDNPDLDPVKDSFSPRLPGRLRNMHITKERRRALILRMVSAVVGGIALIGPMLLMILKGLLVVRLVTVS